MNLNLKIIILISLVGIFTVSSFIFDQMVIYSEDKIREKNFLYKRSFNNYLASKNVMFTTRDLMTRIQVKKNFFEDRQSFLQDAVSVLFNDDMIKSTFDENVGKNYFKNLLSEIKKKELDIVFPDYGEIINNKFIYKKQPKNFSLVPLLGFKEYLLKILKTIL